MVGSFDLCLHYDTLLYLMTLWLNFSPHYMMYITLQDVLSLLVNYTQLSELYTTVGILDLQDIPW